MTIAPPSYGGGVGAGAGAGVGFGGLGSSRRTFHGVGGTTGNASAYGVGVGFGGIGGAGGGFASASSTAAAVRPPADFDSLLASSDSLLSSLGGGMESSSLMSRSAHGATGSDGRFSSSSLPLVSSSSPPHPASYSAAASHLRRDLRELGYAGSRIGTEPLPPPVDPRTGAGAGATGAAIPYAASPYAGTAAGISAAMEGAGVPLSSSSSSSAPSWTTLTYAAEASAHRLLARSGYGFDSARLGRDARDLEMHAHADAAAIASASAGMRGPPRTPFGARSGLLRGGGGDDDVDGNGNGNGNDNDNGNENDSNGDGDGAGSYEYGHGGGYDVAAGGTGGGGAAAATRRGRGLGPPMSFATVESFLSAHQNAIVSRILSEHRTRCEADSELAVERRMLQDFCDEKKRWLERRGSRSTTTATATATATATTMAKTDGAGEKKIPTILAAAAAAAAQGAPFGDRGRRAALENANDRNVLPFFSHHHSTTSSYYYSTPVPPPSPESIERGASAVASHNNRVFKSPPSDPHSPAELAMALLSDLRRTAQEDVGVNSNASTSASSASEPLPRRRVGILGATMNGGGTAAASAAAAAAGAASAYSAALEVLGAALLPPGATARVQPRSGGATDDDLARDRALGMMHRLAEQFRDCLTDRVRRAALSGQSSSSSRSSSFATAGMNGLAADAFAYVSLEIGTMPSSLSSSSSSSSRSPTLTTTTNESASDRHSATTAWRVLYACLRCGDAISALDAIRAAVPATALDPNVRNAVEALARYQGSVRVPGRGSGGDGGGGGGGGENGAPTTIWEAARIRLFENGGGFGGGRDEGLRGAVPVDAREALVDASRVAMGPSSSSSSGANDGAAAVAKDPYRVACLGLLSLSGSPVPYEGGGGGGGGSGGSGNFAGGSASSQSAFSTEVVRSVEDFLYSALWYAAHAPNASSCSLSLKRLGNSVVQWGPDHFEDNLNPSGGWAYALPLLATQRFSSALTHAAMMGGESGIMRACHLVLLIRAAGAECVDLGSDGKSGEGVKLTASLLVAHAQNIQQSYPDAALEYLVNIPDDQPSPSAHITPAARSMRTSRAARQRIARLISESRAFEVLAGIVAADGAREAASGVAASGRGDGPGALDRLFAPGEVSALLGEAAEASEREGRTADAAELLALSGRYGALVRLLNRELSSALATVHGGESEHVIGERESWGAFWRDAAGRFYSLHLSPDVSAMSRVPSLLEAEGGAAAKAVEALRLNLGLVDFFGLARAGRRDEALRLLDDMALLPCGEGDVSARAENYRSLDSTIRSYFRRVVDVAMDCIFREHEALKARRGGMGIGLGGRDVAAAVEHRLAELRSRAQAMVNFAGLVDPTGDMGRGILRMEAYMV